MPANRKYAIYIAGQTRGGVMSDLPNLVTGGGFVGLAAICRMHPEDWYNQLNRLYGLNGIKN